MNTVILKDQGAAGFGVWQAILEQPLADETAPLEDGFYLLQFDWNFVNYDEATMLAELEAWKAEALADPSWVGEFGRIAIGPFGHAPQATVPVFVSIQVVEGDIPSFGLGQMTSAFAPLPGVFTLIVVIGLLLSAAVLVHEIGAVLSPGYSRQMDAQLAHFFFPDDPVFAKNALDDFDESAFGIGDDLDKVVDFGAFAIVGLVLLALIIKAPVLTHGN